jgi:pyruvate/2-oxoglutarate/acetoin dehydrogenase E1 component
MPVSAQVERLTHMLEARQRGGVSAEIVDLYSLEGVQRDLALDAVVAGVPSPLVFVGDRLVCTGSVDVASVLNAIG